MFRHLLIKKVGFEYLIKGRRLFDLELRKSMYRLFLALFLLCSDANADIGK